MMGARCRRVRGRGSSITTIQAGDQVLQEEVSPGKKNSH